MARRGVESGRGEGEGTIDGLTGAPLTAGAPAPSFTLPSQFGEQIALRDAERSSLLVFYPFAFSGICTSELTAVQADLDNFDNDTLRVLAISCDPMYTLRAWSQDRQFEFPLLSDFWPHGAASRAYGVFDERSGMAVRGTFLVDPSGTVRWTSVNGPGRARDFAAIRDAVRSVGT